MPAALSEIPVKPNTAAIIAINKKMNVQRNIAKGFMFIQVQLK